MPRLPVTTRFAIRQICAWPEQVPDPNQTSTGLFVRILFRSSPVEPRLAHSSPPAPTGGHVDLLQAIPLGWAGGLGTCALRFSFNTSTPHILSSCTSELRSDQWRVAGLVAEGVEFRWHTEPPLALLHIKSLFCSIQYRFSC